MLRSRKFIKVGVGKVGKVEVGHFTSDSATLRPMVCCGSEVMTYIILFTFLLMHLVQPVHEFLWKLAQIDSSPAGPACDYFTERAGLLALCQQESWAGRVNPRMLRVPACAGQVREPAELCVQVRGEHGLNLVRVG